MIIFSSSLPFLSAFVSVVVVVCLSFVLGFFCVCCVLFGFCFHAIICSNVYFQF